MTDITSAASTDPFSRPRALFITPIHPASTGLGLAMRMGLIAEALSRIADLEVVVVPVAGKLSVPDDLLRRLGAVTHWIDLSEGADTALMLISAMTDPQQRVEAFARYGKPSLSGLVGPRLRTRLATLMDQLAPDIVVIGRAYLAHLAELAAARSPVALDLDLDEDDVRSCASQAREIQAADPLGARWILQEGEATRRLIDRAKDRVQLALVASPADTVALRRRHDGLRTICVPNAVHYPPMRMRRQAPLQAGSGNTILFVGALGYEPNIRGVLWFVKTVLPRLRRVVPPVRLLVAGARPDDRIRQLARRSGIEVIADPASIAPLYARASLVVAPLLDGGGTRIKIIEAVVHGRQVVATPAALSGLGKMRGVTRAPVRPEAFARSCQLALDNSTAYVSARITRRFDAAFAVPALARQFNDLVVSQTLEHLKLPHPSVKALRGNGE